MEKRLCIEKNAKCFTLFVDTYRLLYIPGGARNSKQGPYYGGD